MEGRWVRARPRRDIRCYGWIFATKGEQNSANSRYRCVAIFHRYPGSAHVNHGLLWCKID